MEAEASLAVGYVRALMERHGLPKYRQSAWLANATGLSYSQAHRRMTGVSPWTLEELAEVASMFGETLADVIGSRRDEREVSGVVDISGLKLPCRMVLGDVVTTPRPATLVAVDVGDSWLAIAASQSAGRRVFDIERIDIRPLLPNQRVIAVIDDDKDLADSICAHFRDSGFQAHAFYATAGLLSLDTIFDGYVMDWIVNDSNVLGVITSIREKSPTCPIIVLTGQVMSGLVDEDDIADAVTRFDLIFHEKPVRTSILVATLTRALTAADPRGT